MRVSSMPKSSVYPPACIPPARMTHTSLHPPSSTNPLRSEQARSHPSFDPPPFPTIHEYDDETPTPRSYIHLRTHHSKRSPSAPCSPLNSSLMLMSICLNPVESPAIAYFV